MLMDNCSSHTVLKPCDVLKDLFVVSVVHDVKVRRHLPGVFATSCGSSTYHLILFCYGITCDSS